MEGTVNSSLIAGPLHVLLSELVLGVPQTGGYMLNRGDTGMIASLDRFSAEEASRIIDGGSSIAAHVDHVLYYITLMNRWASGEKNPWKDADWKLSWTRTTITADGWATLRAQFDRELRRWLGFLGDPREVSQTELTSMMASVVHLAYHLGAIRQMDRKARGPSANNEIDAFTA